MTSLLDGRKTTCEEWKAGAIGECEEFPIGS